MNSERRKIGSLVSFSPSLQSFHCFSGIFTARTKGLCLNLFYGAFQTRLILIVNENLFLAGLSGAIITIKTSKTYFFA